LLKKKLKLDFTKGIFILQADIWQQSNTLCKVFSVKFSDHMTQVYMTIS